MTPNAQPRRFPTRNVTAVLGPTNTGKTHLAIERMLGHETGMIGLPLRLLAREVYARVAGRAGENQVALVTGEEKVVPPNPRYWVSTVEAMPGDVEPAFVAIDEVQIAADLERGHTFTDRLLNMRGTQETLLLGAATMRRVIETLLPGVAVVTRPRMSVLTYAGQKKITRLPERSAAVAFSAGEVYAIAELIRRQRGGAAVVLGALSPRTRNKQVELYQSGDVNFIVATDAIGMGLNLDIDHVAFAQNHKFDGYQNRPLTAAELGQVAGRAGRHMRDGTFGVTSSVEPFDDRLVQALETHAFEPVRVLQWRNDELDFSSLQSLVASLEEPASIPGLTKAPPADDLRALETLSRDPEVRDLAATRPDVRRLWDVCRLPDYRKIAPAQHNALVSEIFGFLMRDGAVPADWFAAQVRHADRTDGDIDTLSQRVAHIRTWTFIANQPDWLADPVHWRGEARKVEDALSDALHEKLTQRFVDRRTSVLMRRLRENAEMDAVIETDGSVSVEDHHVGRLEGFRFTPDAGAEGADAKAVRAATQKAVAQAIVQRADTVARAPAEDLVLGDDGNVRWHGQPLARVIAGESPLRPRLVLLADEHLSGPSRDAVEARLNTWLSQRIETVLKPLVDLSRDEALEGMARGVAFRLVEGLGSLDRREVLEDVRGLDQEARASLRRHGVRFGAYHIFIPALLKPAASRMIAFLWSLGREDEVAGLSELPAISASGRTSIDVDPSFDVELYRLVGFRPFGQRAVRLDILERLADLIRPALGWRSDQAGERPAGAVEGRGFTVTQAMTSLLGASGEDIAVILKGLGYRVERIPAPAAGDAAPDRATDAPRPGGTDGSGASSGSDDGHVAATADAETEAPSPHEATLAPDDEMAAPAPVPEANSEATSLDPAAEVAAEPEMIEIWRPAPTRGRRPHRPAGAAQQGKDGRQDRPERTGRAKAGAKRANGKGSRHKPGEQQGRDERKRGQKGAHAPRADRRAADPNSPFAALAALKADLEKAK